MQCCCANQATDVWLTSWTSDLWLLLLFGPGHVEVQRRLLQHSCAVLISDSSLLEANCTVSFASATSLKCGTSSRLLVLLILCRLFFRSRTVFSVPISYLVGECWLTQWLCANQEAPGAFQQLEVFPDKAEWVLSVFLFRVLADRGSEQMIRESGWNGSGTDSVIGEVQQHLNVKDSWGRERKGVFLCLYKLNRVIWAEFSE